MIKKNHFDKVEPYIIKIAPILAVIFLSLGVYYALFNSPEDYQQKDFVRIMYIHVPSAWIALGGYFFIGICSICHIIWQNQLMEIIARKSAIIGALFCALTLITGSLWGKPIWGTWWVWDARLTSMLILFFLYLGYIILTNSLENKHNSTLAPAVLAIVGMINVPIIKFSVNLWTTLHQPASVFRIDGPTIHISMLIPLFVMFTGCVLFYIFIVTIRVKEEFLQKKILRIMQVYSNY